MSESRETPKPVMKVSSPPKKSTGKFYTIGSALLLVLLITTSMVHYQKTMTNIGVHYQKTIANIGSLTQSLEKTCMPSYENGNFIPVPTSDSKRCLLLPTNVSPYLRLMRQTLVGLPMSGAYHPSDPTKLLPYNEHSRVLGTDWPPFGYTMIGKSRLESVHAAVNEVNRNNIPGAIVELGVWRGGAMMLAAAIGKESGIKRDVYLFDAFEPIGNYGSQARQDFLSVTLEDVKSNFQYFDLLDTNIHFEKGLFKDTVPAWKNVNTSIAVLRIDGNFYDSHQDAMYYFYEKVPVGGIVIFDDIMTHPEVQRFWKEFKSEQGLSEEIVPGDHYSGWFRKEKDIVLDWKYFRPPQDVNKV